MKTLVITAVIAAALTGCASSQRMSIEDLNNFQYDCSRYDEQREFLLKQYPSRRDRQAALLGVGSIMSMISSKVEGTYDQHQSIRTGELQATVKYKLHQLDVACGMR